MKTIKLLALFITTSLVFSACSDDHDDHDHDHEEELITTITYTLTSGNDVVTLSFKDLDGFGGNAGVATVSGPLQANTTYTGSLKLENETESPTEDVTAEVKEEDDEHELFYTTNVAGVTIVKTDVDGNNNPLGLETTFTTGSIGTGSLTITLKHEPTKPNDGTLSGAGGVSEAQATFSVSVE
ncbi:type 1 periplasmic binding fold superfamily protein [Polaribacter aestuariivivens]|uniref:type 1 periplasmic binding fold superfamily protein n=1 Tax=Polaribacter aestuariivivens TaxID=2304626 RepID=UPI003F495674